MMVGVGQTVRKNCERLKQGKKKISRRSAWSPLQVIYASLSYFTVL